MGTFPYMSPEQVRGENAEPTSDIFSLGSLLYEAISGRRVFARPSAAETMSAILKDDPAPLDSRPELDRIIRRCLAKEAQQRFQTAREVAAVLGARWDRSRATDTVAPRRLAGRSTVRQRRWRRRHRLSVRVHRRDAHQSSLAGRVSASSPARAPSDTEEKSTSRRRPGS